MRSVDASPTSELWSVTHAALCAGRWSIARRLLEDLARRSDFTDTLPSVEGYSVVLQLTGKSCPLDAGFRVLLQDRIDAVNSRAERNAA
jgi:hypothetical protein